MRWLQTKLEAHFALWFGCRGSGTSSGATRIAHHRGFKFGPSWAQQQEAGSNRADRGKRCSGGFVGVMGTKRQHSSIAILLGSVRFCRRSIQVEQLPQSTTATASSTPGSPTPSAMQRIDGRIYHGIRLVFPSYNRAFAPSAFAHCWCSLAARCYWHSLTSCCCSRNKTKINRTIPKKTSLLQVPHPRYLVSCTTRVPNYCLLVLILRIYLRT